MYKDGMEEGTERSKQARSEKIFYDQNDFRRPGCFPSLSRVVAGGKRRGGSKEGVTYCREKLEITSQWRICP